MATLDPPTKAHLESLQADFASRRSIFGDDDERTLKSKAAWDDGKRRYHAALPPEARARGLNSLIYNKQQRRAGRVRRLEQLERQIRAVDETIEEARRQRELLVFAHGVVAKERDAIDQEIESAKIEKAAALEEAAKTAARQRQADSAVPAAGHADPMAALDSLVFALEGHPQRQAVSNIIQALQAVLGQGSTGQPQQRPHQSGEQSCPRRSTLPQQRSTAAWSAGESDFYESGLETPLGNPAAAEPAAAAGCTAEQAKLAAMHYLQEAPTPVPAAAPMRVAAPAQPAPEMELVPVHSHAQPHALVPSESAATGRSKLAGHRLGGFGQRQRAAVRRASSADVSVARARSRDRVRRTRERRGRGGGSRQESPMVTDGGAPIG